jgi:5-methylthioadenosine/S-adenosylhomocysteine deaminase
MRVNVDLLIFAKWIIPVEPENIVHENYALVINEGKIIDLIPGKEAEHKYEAADTQHLDTHAIIPGLINAHTHTAMSLFKGLADDLPLMDWLNNHIWPAESKWVDPQFVADGSRLAIAEMIRSGTTCFNDMYFFPDITAEVASDVGIRASVGLIIIDFPTAWANGPQEYFEKGEMVHDKFRNNPLIQTSFAPHAPYTVSDQPIKKISILAEELDIPIHMHIHETEFEVSQSLEQSGVTPLQRLHDLGLLSQRLQAVHMTQLNAESIELVTRFNINIIHCPESNLKLASGFCPVQQLQLAGINVALGTDGSASNNDLNMLGEMRSAALIGKGITNDPCALSAMTVLKMATINGARAMDISEICGSIVPGKSADIVAIDLDTVETQPVYDPISQIVYAADRSQVSDVWVAGKQLLQNRKLTTLDINQIKHSAQMWKDKIKPNK